MSTGHVDGTRGPGIVSSAADVLWMSVVRRIRGIGGVCEMCMYFARGSVGGEGERIGFGFNNHVGPGEVLDVCLCFGCSGVRGVGGEWLGAWTRVWRSGVVLCMCEL